MDSEPPVSKPKRSWKWWALVGINVIGLALVIPLLQVAVPLTRIWWQTRSQSSLVAAASRPPSSFATADVAVATEDIQTNNQLQSLTNQLSTVSGLSETEIQQIVAQQLGSAAAVTSDDGRFDLASAVFESISRTNVVYQGKTYYGYRVTLVDQHGRHKTNVDCFAEPNLEYERSLQTLELINGSPQLQKIYRAMAGNLAARSSTNSDPDSGEGRPAFRLEPDGSNR